MKKHSKIRRIILSLSLLVALIGTTALPANAYFVTTGHGYYTEFGPTPCTYAYSYTLSDEGGHLHGTITYDGSPCGKRGTIIIYKVTGGVSNNINDYTWTNEDNSPATISNASKQSILDNMVASIPNG